MKKYFIGALAIAALGVSAKTLVVHLNSGETQKYEISEIAKMSFEESQLPPETFVSLDSFTDPVLRAAVATADADGDNQLSESEIATITEINLSSSEIASLEGIEHLIALKTLNLQSCSGLTEVDLTGKVPGLQLLQVGFCSNLKNLVLGEKPVLTEVYAMFTGLSSIDVTGAEALEYITVQDAKIENIVMNGLTKLNTFKAGGSTLKSIDLSGCDNLMDIGIYSASNMESFDSSLFPNLETLAFEGSKVTRFVTTGNPKLKYLSLNSSSNLSYVDVSKSRKLNTLSCSYCYTLAEGEENVVLSEGQTIANMNGVNSWNITRVPYEWPEDIATELADEDFRNLMIEVADTDKDGKISKDEALAVTSLVAPNAGLKSVDLSFFNNIEVLDLSGNELTEIDFSGNKNITDLNLENNKLTGTLEVQYFDKLEYLRAAHNELTGLSSFGARGPVKEIDLSYNKFESITLYFFSNVTKINVSHNELTRAEIRDNDKLTDMDVSFNKISEMTLWSLKALERVNFNDNPFIQLDESNRWVNLKEIDCSNTDITKLDLSKTNTLWTVKATGCPNLSVIYVGNNADAEIYKDYNTTVSYTSPE